MFNRLFWFRFLLFIFFSIFFNYYSPNIVHAVTFENIIPQDRKIDWTYAGIPGGIPTRTTICRTIDASIYGNGSTDATAVIQTALNNCPTDQVVYLPEGTYLVSSTLWMKSHEVLRGAGMGKTILKHTGTNTSEMVAIAGYGSGNEVSIPNPRSVSQAVKNTTSVTIDNVTGISVGDVLLINQLNDGINITKYGSDPKGFCWFCGIANGDRALGQYVEVVAVAGNTVSINVPLHWTYDSTLTPQAYRVAGTYLKRWVGIEDLTVTQDTAVVGNMIELNFVQYSWVKNVEISHPINASLGGYHVIQSEFTGVYMHDGISGAGAGEGYGISITMYSSNNLIYNNIVKNLDGGGLENHGGASGNVIAYNYLNNIIYNNPSWLTASPAMNHGTHPKMNLWESNVAYMAEGDFNWGSSSHNTVYRSRSLGWMNDTATINNAAIRFAQKNYFMNILANVLGTPGKSNTYEYIAGQSSYNSRALYIWALGYDPGVTGGSPDPMVFQTLIRHGNFDYVTNSTIWDPNISNHILPPSLYLSQKPSWWCNETPWPPIGPDVTGGTEDPAGHVYKIPAQRKFEGLPCTLGLRGDINADGVVNILDYTLLSNAFGTNNSASDLNNDGTVNILDYTILSNNFGA